MYYIFVNVCFHFCFWERVLFLTNFVNESFYWIFSSVNALYSIRWIFLYQYRKWKTWSAAGEKTLIWINFLLRDCHFLLVFLLYSQTCTIQSWVWNPLYKRMESCLLSVLSTASFKMSGVRCIVDLPMTLYLVSW